MIVKYIFAAIAVEAITEILIHSTLLDKLRNALRKVGVFDDLFSCGWCMSVWAALFVFGLFVLRIEFVLAPIIMHRLSNYLHVIYNLVKYRDRRER